MGESSTSQHRTSLIRQMARDLQRSRPISVSSRASDTNSNIDNESTSEFDPSADGLGSTRNGEMSQQLPPLRASAQDPHRHDSAPEPDYDINTSALGRAFPIFSQSGSENGSDNSRSVEVGRGHRARHSLNEHSSLAFDINLNALSSSTSKKDGGSLRRALNARRSPEKREFNESPSTVKATDYVSSNSRHSSAEPPRRQEQGDNNGTQISDDRPASVNITSRSSRFAAANVKPSIDLPKNFKSSNDFLKDFPTVTDTMRSNLNSYLASPMPKMPEISELVSGSLKDGTPVFSRFTKARATSGSSRFASQGRKSRVGYHPVGGLAVPEEEEQIFVSLKVLQEKLGNLENQNAAYSAQIQSLKEKERTLEAKLVERGRQSSRDSGIGHASGSDGDDEFGHGSRKAIIEKTRKYSHRAVTSGLVKLDSPRTLQGLQDDLDHLLHAW